MAQRFCRTRLLKLAFCDFHSTAALASTPTTANAASLSSQMAATTTLELLKDSAETLQAGKQVPLELMLEAHVPSHKWKQSRPGAVKPVRFRTLTDHSSRASANDRPGSPHPGAGGRLPMARRGRILWRLFVPLAHWRGGGFSPLGGDLHGRHRGFRFVSLV